LRIQNQARTDAKTLARRWKWLPASQAQAVLVPPRAESLHIYERHIENLIGELRLPIGVAGPLRVNGLFAKGDFFVPMATTEAALVASYNRGCITISEAGGSTAVMLAEGVTRTPGFVFTRVADAGRFAVWVSDQEEHQFGGVCVRRVARLPMDRRHNSKIDLVALRLLLNKVSA
jgi:hydroxymethylglutaryl-CoA reductase (NADPH)